jgi:plasmid stabilization system protein ParE
MNYLLAFSPGAEEDIISANLWYERIDPHLAGRFLLETDSIIDGITQFPYRFALVAAAVRRALLKRFPYAIYYPVNYNEVFLIAVVHQRRSERFWMQRDRR